MLHILTDKFHFKLTHVLQTSFTVNGLNVIRETSTVRPVGG